MTPRLDAGSNPFSAITIAGLQDLGYSVNPGAADPYSINSINAACRAPICNPPASLTSSVSAETYTNAVAYGQQKIAEIMSQSTMMSEEEKHMTISVLVYENGEMRSVMVTA